MLITGSGNDMAIAKTRPCGSKQAQGWPMIGRKPFGAAVLRSQSRTESSEDAESTPSSAGETSSEMTLRASIVKSKELRTALCAP